jgi:general secretion pathway protein I
LRRSIKNIPGIPGKKGEEAFTLLEVMVALAIIAVALTTLILSQSRNISLQDDTKFSTTAAMLAQKKIAEIEVKNELELTNESDSYGDDYPDYSWEVKIDDVSFEGAEEFTKYFKQIDVTIYRGEKKQNEYSVRLYKFVRS